jgi:DNA-binding HxlR family transcriptional regulator
MQIYITYKSKSDEGLIRFQLMNEGSIMYSAKGMISCPVDNTFKIISKKFTILLIRNMLSNQCRFNQFLETIPGINSKTLSARLREIEKNGLITRKVYHDTPLRVEYSLTKKGLAAKPILDQMADYSLKHCSNVIFEDAKPRTLQEVVH